MVLLNRFEGLLQCLCDQLYFSLPSKCPEFLINIFCNFSLARSLRKGTGAALSRVLPAVGVRYSSLLIHEPRLLELKDSAICQTEACGSYRWSPLSLLSHQGLDASDWSNPDGSRGSHSALLGTTDR